MHIFLITYLIGIPISFFMSLYLAPLNGRKPDHIDYIISGMFSITLNLLLVIPFVLKIIIDYSERK